MDSFCMQIADVIFRIHPSFETTYYYCKNYLSTGEPAYEIAATARDRADEQKYAQIEAIEEGLKIRQFTEPFLERAVIQRKIAAALLEHNTLLLHGSTVGVDGAAYIFTAPCGVGKSTHTRFWRELFGRRACMINDDKAFLKLTENGVVAYGSPWSGKHGLDRNVAFPLKGICVLRRSDKNSICRSDPNALWDFLHHQCLNADGENGAKAERLLHEVLQQVPVFEMGCTNHVEAARVSYEAMSGEIHSAP